MRKDVNGRIVLSRRNLLALLHKLDMPGSSCTLVAPGGEFVVSAENDIEHYDGRHYGEMHPDTEAFIEAYKRVKGQ